MKSRCFFLSLKSISLVSQLTKLDDYKDVQLRHLFEKELETADRCARSEDISCFGILFEKGVVATQLFNNIIHLQFHPILEHFVICGDFLNTYIQRGLSHFKPSAPLCGHVRKIFFQWTVAK